MIECIINDINEQICGIVKGARVYGLASTMIRTSNTANQNQSIPATVTKDGEGNFVGIDDTFPMQLYHRLNSVASSLVAKSGFGDNAGDYRNVFNCSMIVYLNRKKTDMFPDDLFLRIQNEVESPVAMENFRNIAIVFAAMNLNETAIFAAEYSNTDFKISTDSNLFSITYTIEAIYQKNCLKLCACK